MATDSSNSPIKNYNPGNMDEMTAIHAFYGQAIDNGFIDTPEYEASAIERFIGINQNRGLKDTFNCLSEWGRLERVFREGEMHSDEEVYKMADEKAKSDSFTIWKYVRDNYSGEIGNMMDEFEQGVREDLEEKGVSLLK